MLVCVNCKVEMKCIKTGSVVRYNDGHHCYASDTFECPVCGAKVARTNEKPYYVESPKLPSPTDIVME